MLSQVVLLHEARQLYCLFTAHVSLRAGRTGATGRAGSSGSEGESGRNGNDGQTGATGGSGRTGSTGDRGLPGNSEPGRTDTVSLVMLSQCTSHVGHCVTRNAVTVRHVWHRALVMLSQCAVSGTVSLVMLSQCAMSDTVSLVMLSHCTMSDTVSLVMLSQCA